MQSRPTRAGPRKGQRNLFCIYYNGCLSRALKRGWEGFSCEACPMKSRSATASASVIS